MGPTVGNEFPRQGRPFEVLYEIFGTQAMWSGSLVRSARACYDATAQGGEFKYRNARFQRLTREEIRDAVGGKDFDLAI